MINTNLFNRAKGQNINGGELSFDLGDGICIKKSFVQKFQSEMCLFHYRLTKLGSNVV